jgi:hypothetical protein
VHDVVLPTLAVVLTWLVVGVVLAGCGYLVRRALAGPGSLGAHDLWIGLAALLAYLQLWSLATGISAYAWIVPSVAGVAGTALAFRPRRVSAAAVGVVGVGVLWLANRSLGPAQDYDLGLYHANVIRYAVDYGTVPGLANLHVRLGASDPHLLLVALLQHGPWAGAAPHLVNGLLVSLLFVEIATRFAAGRRGSFTRRFALLLMPATIAVVGVGTAYRLSSPNLDLAAFVLVCVGALYLAECVEDGVRTTPAIVSAAAFTAAAVTRPLYFLPAAIAAVVLSLAWRRGRAIASLCALPGLLVAGWLARQAVLSGYPLFPTTVAGLPVGWRVPAAVVRSQNRVNDAWARWPGIPADQVFASWHWLSHWAHARVRDFDVNAPLVLLAALAPALLVRGRTRDMRLGPLLAVVLPSLALLVAWFAIAPDPRFALAPLWLLPAALAAWALPRTDARVSPAVLVLAAVAAAGLATLALTHLEWLFLAALDAWALAAITVRGFGSPQGQARLAQAALISLALVPIAFVAYRGAFHIVAADGSGPLGTEPAPAPSLTAFTTRSGLQVMHPVGSDQCWSAVLCAPDPSPDLRLRGATVADGFATVASR